MGRLSDHYLLGGTDDLFSPRLHEKKRATKEAMDLLHEHKEQYIALARDIADELIAKNGSTSTREVYSVMVARNVAPPQGEATHWLGAVFRTGRYRWTGRWDESYVSSSTHASRPVKIWTFVP